MSVAIAVRLVRHRRAAIGFGRLPLVPILLVLAAWGCRASSGSASEFKSLLADAGALVFGNPRGEPSEQSRPTAAALPNSMFVAQRPDESKLPVDRLTDTPKVDATKTGRDADAILRRLLPPRSDTTADWHAIEGCLHEPGEPCALSPCVPPPPCDPSQPPHPHDLVGVRGVPSCGPIYRGPCEPRSGRHHHGVFAWVHHLRDRCFDHFYRSK